MMVGAKYQAMYEDIPAHEFKIGDHIIVFCLFLGAFINGISVGILWASANQYIAESASDSTKGFFFSYFWTFYMASQIFGNLIGAYSLGNLP